MMEEKKPAPRWRLRRFVKLDHGLAMFCFGPWMAYLASGLVYGFTQSPSSFASAVFIWAHWAGIVGIAFIIATVVLIFTKPIAAWLVFLGLSACFIFFSMYPEMKARAGQESAAMASTQLSQESGNSANRIYVSEVVENLPPSQAGATVDNAVISRMNEFVADDYLKRMKVRLKNGRYSGHKIDATAQTIRVNTEGHVLYATELTVYADNKLAQEVPDLRVFWGIQDNQIKRVFCVFPEDGYAWRRGECGKQIAKTFNWDGWWQR